MKTIDVQSRSKEEMIDITSSLTEAVEESGIKNGVCFVYVPHTTAGVTINENADPSVKGDIMMTLGQMVPENLPYRHAEGNSPGHVKASLIGPSVQVFVREGKPVLGTWQGVFFCEFDGPRSRRVHIEILHKKTD